MDLGLCCRRCNSVALLSFGGDSFVELFATSVRYSPLFHSSLCPERVRRRWAGILLFALAGATTLASVVALVHDVQPETSCPGIAITAAALFVMPALAWIKRRPARSTDELPVLHSPPDAVHPPTCAYWLRLYCSSSPSMLSLISVEWNRSLHSRPTHSFCLGGAVRCRVNHCADSGDVNN